MRTTSKIGFPLGLSAVHSVLCILKSAVQTVCQRNTAWREENTGCFSDDCQTAIRNKEFGNYKFLPALVSSGGTHWRICNNYISITKFC